MTEVAERETDSEDVGAPVPPDDAPDDETAEEEAATQEADGEPAGEPPAALSEKEIEKANKALEREATAHANRISKIMGEAAQDLVPCELCWELTPGFHWPNEAVPMPDAQREAVLAAIGQGPDDAPPLREAEGVVMCDRCDGWGELLFPSRRPHTEKQPCPACNGKGYKLAPEPESNVTRMAPTSTGTGITAHPSTYQCPLCSQTVEQGQGHWCVPAASAGG